MTWLRVGWRNLRFALRILRKAPAWTLTAVVTLALGIGATLAMYTLVDHVLLRPLPWQQPDRLVRLYQHDVQRGSQRNSVSPPNFLDWRAAATSFESLAAWDSHAVTLSGAGLAPERFEVTFASAELFDLLRVTPELGRVFQPSENELGRDRVVVLSHGIFASRFGGSPEVIGKTVLLDGVPYEVVGVMPTGFGYPDEDAPTMWAPIAFEPDEHRGSQYLSVLGRLRDGAALEAARSEMTAFAERMMAAHPDDTNFMAINVFRLHDDRVHEIDRALLLLLGAVGLLLMIACANVAHLLLARWRDRRRELAVRTALGASRGQLLGQTLVEAALLASAGAALGLLLAQWALDFFIRVLPQALPGLDAVAIDGRIVAGTLALVGLTVAVFGLAPALAATQELEVTMRAESGRTSASRERTRFGRALIVGEVALAATLVVGAALLVRSLGAMIDLDPGFRTSALATFRVGLPEQRYDTLDKTARFFDRVLERTRALPGVESASAVGWLPLGGTWGCSFKVDGRPEDPGRPKLMGLFRPVGNDYFRTMGIPLRRGRTFEPTDRAGSPPVIVIDEALAAKYFPDSDPLGQQMRFDCGGKDEPMRTIIGVVGGVRQYHLTDELLPGYYIPYGQLYWDTMSIVMRTAAALGPLVDEIRREIRRLDPELAVYDVETIEDRLARALARPRLQSLLFGGFAVLALTLGAAGVYGVMAYSVARRRHEMGVRAAFGARAGDLVRQVLGEGMSLVATGLAAGLLLAAAASRLLASLLFGVSTTDPRAFAVAAVVLGAAALAACWLPARRAGRVDVARMLRVD